MTAAVRARRGAIARPISPRAVPAAELDLHVGRDLAVVGFDGSVGTALLHPHLTSTRLAAEAQPKRPMRGVLTWRDLPGQDDVRGFRRGFSR